MGFGEPEVGLGEHLIGEMGRNELGEVTVASIDVSRVGRRSASEMTLGDLGRKSAFLSVGQGIDLYFLMMRSPLLEGLTSASKVSLVLGILTVTKHTNINLPGMFELVMLEREYGF